VDRPIICDLTSKDVIHSFYIPVMRVKHDVIPGMSFPVWFQATQTGKFQVACAQLCGNNHYNMKADMTIYSAEEFESWYADRAGGDEDEEEEEE
jgi:cytochrome c oxidase subunit 2